MSIIHIPGIRAAAIAAIAFAATPAPAADYEVDPGHSFVQFRIQHLGYSWLYGRFNDVSGEFTHDPENPSANTIKRLSSLRISTSSTTVCM